MAEFVMKELVKEAGRAAEFEIASAATSTEEIGNPVYPPVRRLLNAHGISCSGKTARQMTAGDCAYYDLLIGMDSANFRNISRLAGAENSHKVHLLLDYTNRPGSVADPWYTGDFDATWRDVQEGCRGLLKKLDGQ